MNTSNKTIREIRKEMIDNLLFPTSEVLIDPARQYERMQALHRATGLGNLEKHKVKIVFEDGEGLKRVYTTIWAITDRKAVLKGGRTLPVNRIHSVILH